MKNYLLAAAFSLLAMPAFAGCAEMEQEIGLLFLPEVLMIAREYDIDPMDAAELAGIANMDAEVMGALPPYISRRMLGKRDAFIEFMIDMSDAGCF